MSKKVLDVGQWDHVENLSFKACSHQHKYFK